MGLAPQGETSHPPPTHGPGLMQHGWSFSSPWHDQGKASLSVSLSPKLRPALPSPFAGHQLPAPPGHSLPPFWGCLGDRLQHGLSQARGPQQTLPAPLWPALRTQGGFGPFGAKAAARSSKNHHCYTTPSAPINWAPSQVNSLAGTRNLIISAHIPEASLTFQNTFYISYSIPRINS